MLRSKATIKNVIILIEMPTLTSTYPFGLLEVSRKTILDKPRSESFEAIKTIESK
jgi:hypothetical protein